MSLKIGSNQISPIQINNVINNQSNKTVTPTKSVQTITQDTGYDGLTQVTVNSIPTSYIIPTGTLTITNSGTVNASQYANVSIPGMANPTWTAATITSNAAKVVYSINLTSGFKNASQSFSSSYTLPSVAGTTITPTTTAQTAVAQYKWTTGSIIIDAIPNSILVYQKILEKTVNVNEANEFLSSQTSIPMMAFASCKSLSGILNLGSVSIVGSSAFDHCSYITQVIGPNVVTLSSTAFAYCSRITSVSFPNVTRLEYSVFGQCSSLSSLYLPELISGQLSGCQAQYVDLPKVPYLSTYYFYNCTKLMSFKIPSVTSISGGTIFYNCSSLTSVYIPNLSLISGTQVFSSCKELQVVSLPKLQRIASSNVFSNCPKLTSIYLMSTTMVTLTYSNIFSGTSIPIVNSTLTGAFGSIYVPNSLLNTYKTNSLWSWYSDRFVGV